MAGLLGATIITFCATTGGTYNAACNSALDQGAQQFGIRREVDNVEDMNVKRINRELIYNFGPQATGALAGSMFLVGAIANKKLTVNLPTYGLCSSLRTEIAESIYRLSVEWTF